MNFLRPTIVSTIAILMMHSSSSGQVVRNRIEANQNRRGMATNKVQLNRDTEEIGVFRSKLSAFEDAILNNNVEGAMRLKKDLLLDMKREIEQSEHKILLDKREASQSQAEVRGSSREVNRSRFERAKPGNNLKDTRSLRDDRRDKRDDRRDARDDRSDLQDQISRTERQKEIYSSIQNFTFSEDASAQEKVAVNKSLLEEFISTMQMDLAATKAEIGEDRRESFEDGRERREDRREIRDRGGRW